jgi:hypothetical protein
MEFDSYKLSKDFMEVQTDLMMVKATIIELKRDIERLKISNNSRDLRIKKLQNRLDDIQEPSQIYYNSQSPIGNKNDASSDVNLPLIEKSQKEEVFRNGTTNSKAKYQPLSSSSGIDKVKE